MTKRALLPLLLCTSLAAQSPPQLPAPKAQTPPDQKAFNAARVLADPDQKLAALRQFVLDFPKSTRKDSATNLIFTTLLDHFPQRSAEIDAEARRQLKGNHRQAKWGEETYLAKKLASVEPAGADLNLASKYANDALKHYTEPKLTKIYYGYFKGEPAPRPAAAQHYYANTRAGALAATAFVAYRQGNLPLATTQLDQAYALAPLNTDVNALRGQIAYDQHRNAEALTDYERAQVSGALTKSDRAHLAELYAQANPSGDLQSALDTTYHQLYAESFKPAAHTPAPAGHTALLELYTGSGCPPCVGGDLAVEALLDSHPRTELIALAYDLHIPKADPLTSPDTVARAAWAKVSSTPSYVLDGSKLGAFGGSREDAGELYGKLVKVVDEQAAKPSKVQLQLTTSDTAGSISAHAVVTLGDLAALTQPTFPTPLPDPSARKPAPVSVAKPAAVVATPHYILNLALVEDDVRYSGENGVRFHRMVVRALARPSETGFPLEPGKAITVDTSFDPTAIAEASRAYLESYEKTNDRFGPLEFLAKPVIANPAHLAIAAWVQDADTHRVLQSTFLPLTPGTPQAGTK